MRTFSQNIIGNRTYRSLHEAPGIPRINQTHGQPSVQEQKRDARDRKLLALFTAESDEKKIAVLAKSNPRLKRCELCHEWFFKKAVDDENICLVCQEGVQGLSGGTHGHKNGTCKWCGRAFQRLSPTSPSLYCGPDCLHMATRLKCREAVRASRKD